MLACGAGTDQLPAAGAPARRDRGAYSEQLDLVQSAGPRVILMASRALAAGARSPGDYLDIYGYLLKQADRPVILHWLGEAFDPALRGYWGGTDFGAAADTVIELISGSAGRSAGSSCRCSTRPASSRCAGGCRPASGSTPATTTTTPS